MSETLSFNVEHDFRKEVEREMKAAERRLHDDNDRLTSEVARLKQEIEAKITEKYHAVEDAKADGDQRVSLRHWHKR